MASRKPKSNRTTTNRTHPASGKKAGRSDSVSKDGLNDKQRAFVEVYLSNGFNATQAAVTAGYSEKTARQMGSENLTKPSIRKAIDQRLGALSMGANEVLYRLSQQAQSSMESFVDIDIKGLPHLDLNKAAREGKLHLIKKLTYDKLGNLSSIELHDPQAALVHLGRHHKLFTDRVEVTANWRKTLEDAGIDAASAFQELVDYLASATPTGARGDDGSGSEGSSSAA